MSWKQSFFIFLKNTNSAESTQDLEEHAEISQEHTQMYENAVSMIAHLKGELIETLSHYTPSNQSQHSKSSSVTALKRAKAEAVHAEIIFAEKEADIRKARAAIAEQEKLQSASAIRKTAELEADLDLISKKKAAAIAEAEANALADEGVSPLLKELGSVKAEDFTSKYVIQQADFIENMKADTKPPIHTSDQVVHGNSVHIPYTVWNAGSSIGCQA